MSNLLQLFIKLFHGGGGPYHIEISPLIHE